MVELPNLDEEGNRLASYEIDVHQLPSLPTQLMFSEMQVTPSFRSISHPARRGSGLSRLPGSNASLQAVRRRSTRTRGLKGRGYFSARLLVRPSDCFECFRAGNRFGH